MRIGIDISTILNHGKDIGAGRYIMNLLKHLFEIDRDDTFVLAARYTTNDYLYLIDEIKSYYNNPDKAASIKEAGGNKNIANAKAVGRNKGSLKFKLFKTTQRKMDIWDRLGFPPLEFMGFFADVFHCPDFLIPPTLNKKIILTIHDLAFMRFPQFNFDWFINKYKRLVKKNSRHAKKIIAVSASTKNDIISYFNTESEKIPVIYEAADQSFKKLKSGKIDKGVLEKFKITKKFILTVGTIEPRKNYVTLIKAFNLLKSFPECPDLQLVIAGRTGWKSEPVFAEYHDSPYKDDIILTGRLGDDDLLQLYNMAELFVFASVFEGFGLPVIEAMQCGLAVLASNTSSIPEIVSDKNMLFDALDPNQIAGMILKVLNDENLRQQFASKSIERAGHFSWKKTARQTLEVYRSVL